MAFTHVVDLFPKLTVRSRVAVPVTCQACGTAIDVRPDATSLEQRGPFAFVREFRTCGCGAFVCSERVAPIGPSSER